MSDEKDVGTPLESFVDKIGQEVRVGDTIAYGHALGRCAGLRIGKVKGIEKVRRAYSRREEWAILVRGVDDDWSGRPSLSLRPGTLQYPTRTLKITTPLPEPYAQILEGV